MFFARLFTRAYLCVTALAWEGMATNNSPIPACNAKIADNNLPAVKWYAGININCTVPHVDEPSGFPFLVRVWESCEGSATCVYANDDTGIAQQDVQCRDDSYDLTGGGIISTAPCTAELGRGSVEVVSGCCTLWSSQTCDGYPYTQLNESQCNQQVQLEGFRCVRSMHTPPADLLI